MSSKGLTPIDTAVGDIDVLAIVGDTVLVGECKCFVRPATSHEWFQVEDGMQRAVRQVREKAEWVQRNQTWVSSISGRNAKTRFEVVSCVILNSPLMSLRAIDGIPIVDQRILYRFFGTSRVSRFKRLDTGKESEPIVIYSNDDGAGKALRGYLRAPPHLSHYRSSIEVDSLRQPDFAGQGAWITKVFPRVNLRVSNELRTALGDDG